MRICKYEYIRKTSVDLSLFAIFLELLEVKIVIYVGENVSGQRIKDWTGKAWDKSLRE